MNIVQDETLLHVGASFGYMSGSGIAGSSGSECYVQFSEEKQTTFRSGFTSLQFHKQWRRVPLSLHPCLHRLSVEILILAILTAVRWKESNGCFDLHFPDD